MAEHVFAEFSAQSAMPLNRFEKTNRFQGICDGVIRKCAEGIHVLADASWQHELILAHGDDATSNRLPWYGSQRERVNRECA
jgi:hypothetical protein